MRKIYNFLAVILLILFAAPPNTRAQSAMNQTAPGSSEIVASNPPAASPNASAIQNVVSSLSILPEADTLIYVNSRRILNELVPKLMPAKDMEEMKKGFEQAKKFANIDPMKIDYIVVATRFKKPTADLNFQLPEFMLLTSGDFSAESLVVLARMASQGKLRDEKYGTKTLGLMTIDPIVKEAEKNPLLKSFTEMAIVPLNANTIAAGSPSYLRAAIDAGDGKDRISADTLNSLVRDPNALISIAGTPWHSFAKSFGMLGTETNARAPRCESKIGDFYAALTMDATNFMLRGAMNEDNPDTAKIISNLLTGFLRHATSSIPDATAQSLLKTLAINAEGNEVTIKADVPQQMVIDLIQQKMKPKLAVTATDTANLPAKSAVKPRRRARRRSVRQ